jgi:hypothetical protein
MVLVVAGNVAKLLVPAEVTDVVKVGGVLLKLMADRTVVDGELVTPEIDVVDEVVGEALVLVVEPVLTALEEIVEEVGRSWRPLAGSQIRCSVALSRLRNADGPSQHQLR